MDTKIDEFKHRHADNKILKERIFGELSNDGGTKDYKGVCPLCRKKSLSISKTLPIFSCFYCPPEKQGQKQWGGDYFDYIQKTENKSFQEALQKVVELAGENIADFKIISEENIERYKTRQKKIETAKTLTEIFGEGLISSAGQKARMYLTEERKFSLSTLQAAKIGYLPKSKLPEVNKILMENNLPTLGDYYGDRITIPISSSHFGCVDFQFRVVGNHQPGEAKYMSNKGADRGWSGLPALKNAQHIVLVESYLEAAYHNADARFNQSSEAWLGLGGCQIASEEMLQPLTKYVKENNIDTITFYLDGDNAGFNSVKKLFDKNILKHFKKIKDKCFFVKWEYFVGEHVKDSFDLLQLHGYNYLNQKELLTNRENNQQTRTIYEHLVYLCFGAWTDEIREISGIEINKGILLLLSAVPEFSLTDIALLEVALKSRFQRNPDIYKQIVAAIQAEIEIIEEQKYQTTVKDWATNLINHCSNTQEISSLLETIPKKDILSIPIHEEPPTEEEWAHFEELIPTGYEKLDEYLGYTRGGLHIIAGRPGEGKTLTMINLMRSQLKRQLDRYNDESFSTQPPSLPKICFITLEESKDALRRKLVLSDSDVIFDKDNLFKNYDNFLSYLKRGYFANKKGKKTYPHQQIIDKIKESKEWVCQCIREKRLTILSPSNYDVVNIAKIMREYNKYFGYDFFFIDYLQMMSSSTTNERNYILGKEIANLLCSFALETNSVIVAGAQLNRNSQNTGDGRPQLGELRESGDYEQKACLVVGLSSPKNITNESTQKEKDTVNVTILKNREGACSNELQMSFKRCTRRLFDEYDQYTND